MRDHQMWVHHHHHLHLSLVRSIPFGTTNMQLELSSSFSDFTTTCLPSFLLFFLPY
jgi:hypothetical protein